VKSRRYATLGSEKKDTRPARTGGEDSSKGGRLSNRSARREKGEAEEELKTTTFLKSSGALSYYRKRENRYTCRLELHGRGSERRAEILQSREVGGRPGGFWPHQKSPPDVTRTLISERKGTTWGKKEKKGFNQFTRELIKRGRVGGQSRRAISTLARRV